MQISRLQTSTTPRSLLVRISRLCGIASVVDFWDCSLASIKSCKLQKSTTIIFCLFLLMGMLPTQAREGRLTLKTQAEYFIPKGEKIKIRVSQIPSKYPWVDRDLEGKVLPPKLGDVIISESYEDLVIGPGKVLPAGTKFYAYVKRITPPGRFKKGNVILNFFKAELNQNSVALNQDVENDHNSIIGNSASKLATVSAGAAGGALAGVFLTYQIGGTAAFSSAYVPAGAAALGAGLGIASGILSRKGIKTVEPGSELQLELDNDWVLSLAKDRDGKPKIASTKSSQAPSRTKVKQQTSAPGVEINVTKVKKKKNLFGDKCLAVTFDYKNNTKNRLRHSSFKLVDSMGKSYEPSPHSMQDNLFGELPRFGTLTLYYAAEFLKAPHNLTAVKQYNQKVLGSQPVVLK